MNCFNTCPEPTEQVNVPPYDSSNDTCVRVCNAPGINDVDTLPDLIQADVSAVS